MKKIVAVLLCCVALLPGFSKGAELSRYETQFFELFDTFTSLIMYAKDKETATHYAEVVYNEMQYYHQQFDIYNSYEGINNIATLNKKAGIEPVKVDEKLIEFLQYSKEMYTLTDGNVNIAMGAVLALWHDARTYGTANPKHAFVPDLEVLKEAYKHCNIEDLIINEEENTVFYADPKLRLDVGAIAKGYAANCIMKAVKEAGATSILLSIGGNTCTMGLKSGDVQYTAGIQNPDLSASNQLIMTVHLQDQMLVTSGDYQRFYTVDEKPYHHIIDPKTLMPAIYHRAVSIIATDSGLADALSTALFIMPLEQGQAFVEKLDGVEALWIDFDGNMVMSDGFPKGI